MSSAYDSASYDSLPMLSEAGRMLDSKRAKDILGDFRSLFLEHETDRTFGLVLNHRHFDMAPYERLVEYNGTSVPWETMHDQIQPSTWMLSDDDACIPYEFHYKTKEDGGEAMGDPSNPKHRSFIKSFNNILRQHDAVGLLGLCAYPGDDFEGRVEITAGRANINLHPDHAPKHWASREAAWFFSPVLYGRCVCICGGNGHTSATHSGHVNSR